MANTRKRSRPPARTGTGVEAADVPRKVEGTSIMDLAGALKKYAPKKPVSVKSMKEAVLEEAAKRDRRGRR